MPGSARAKTHLLQEVEIEPLCLVAWTSKAGCRDRYCHTWFCADDNNLVRRIVAIAVLSSDARDYSMRYSAGGAMGGVVRGALGGAAIGGIVGGGRGARRGAGAGAIVGGASRGIQRSTFYDRAYAHCMRGRWP